MSSWPSRAPSGSVRGAQETTPELQPFPYDAVPPGTTTHAIGMGTSTGGALAGQGACDAAAREAQAHAQGRQQGLAEAREAFDDQLSKERSCLATALAQFARDRASYFQKVEAEVVQLALSIARKILHREAQVDPLLLAGIVRVALEKIDGATGVALRLHPANAADWRRYLATRLEPADLPEIIEDASHPVDRCTLETSMGTTTLGLDLQLKEIEQGLMDLLAARPGAAS
jgi:flagellar assembly protein FliH